MPNINPRIRSLDDLLGVARKVENTAATEDKPAQPGNNEIQMLPPEIIRGFRGHPFRLYEGDRFNDLVDSVSENGVLSPTIIRKIEPDENGFEYEMLAGHNRQNAAIAAKRLLPCIVKENLSDQDAWIYPTAITQNVEYLLDSVQASTMLSNSEFIVMLNQAAGDREKLAHLLNISEEQMSYITNADAGCGLIKYGSALVPFVNRFPHNTELYRLMTTRPGEGCFSGGRA